MNRRFNRQNRQSLQNEHSEDFRIKIDIIFRDFCADSSLTEYAFPANLSRIERKYIHEKCTRLGLKSKSKGKEPNRILSLFKNVSNTNANFELKLGPGSLEAINSFVAKHCQSPKPNFNDLHEIVGDKTNVGKLSFGQFPKVRHAVGSEYEYFRRNLPVFEARDTILRTIEENPVTIISGETGSGKTTQIPQYILEQCCDLSKPCRIICTQPRRISTVAVAERVSIERGEQVGETCGYQIKLDSRLGPSTALIYCTTGVLLRTLMGGFDVLNNISHIIIDEIHERDKFTDFVLISLRQCLQKLPSLRLILMSATLDVELFENYFTNVAKVNVKGRTYPIEHYFLDRILMELKYESEQMKLVKMKNEQRGNTHNTMVESYPSSNEVDECLLQEMDEALLSCMEDPSEENFMQVFHLIISDEVPVDQPERSSGQTPLIVAASKGKLDYVNQLLNLGANISVRCKVGKTAIDWANTTKNFDVAKVMQDFDAKKKFFQGDIMGLYNQTILEDIIDHNLIVAIVEHIHVTSRDNLGVLVFLPGYDDIIALNEVLASAPFANALKICMLHGSMMINAQHEVFKKSNKRKVILSTNVAETSITIDDIAHVIDTGKVKQKSYDSLSGTSTLETTWISIASLKQRAGRAGRCAPGKCYHLFSTTRYESLLVNTIPEILTVPLHELCLQTKSLAPQGTRIADFLSNALEAPSASAIETAIAGLVSLGALDTDENLTILGSHLLRLSIEPHLGKMLLYSIVLKCLDPVLTIVATLAHKDPFMLPTKGVEKQAASMKKKSLSFGTLSDHLGLLMAFQKWQEAKMTSEHRFCREFYISASCMDMILMTRNQITSQLRAAGFIPVSAGIREVTQYNDSWPMIKAALCAGLYPNVAFSHNNRLVSRTEKRVLVHSSSCVRGTNEEFSGLWYIFEEMSKIRNLCNLKSVTAVTPLTVVLMAGSTNHFDESENNMQIDSSLSVNIHFQFIWKFRLAVDSLIQKYVARPTSKFNQFEEAVLTTLQEVLNSEETYFNLPQPTGIGKKPLLYSSKNSSHGFKSPGQRKSNEFDSYRKYDTKNNRFSNNNNYGNREESYCNPPQATGIEKQPFPKNSFHAFKSAAQGNSREFDRKYDARSDRFGNNCNYRGRGQRGFGRQSQNYATGRPTNGYCQSFNDDTHSPASSSCSSQERQITEDNDRFGQDSNTLIDVIAPRNLVISPRAKFYIVRPMEIRNIMISLSQGTWNFSPQTERKAFSGFLQGYEIYLLFSVRGTSEFQAAAKLTDTNHGVANAPGRIEWISTMPHNHQMLSQINPWSGFLEDGFELPYDVGVKTVMAMLKSNDQRPKHYRPILDTQEKRYTKRHKRKKSYIQQDCWGTNNFQ